MVTPFSWLCTDPSVTYLTVLSHVRHVRAAALLLRRRYGLTELVSLGSFANTRQECTWRGFTLELDETRYPWGCLHELEAETVRGGERDTQPSGGRCRAQRAQS
jgi:hypothetical protein